MKNLLRLSALFFLFATTLCLAQDSIPSSQAGTAPTPSAPAATSAAASPDAGLRGAFPTFLTRTADSKKLKPGDIIVCRISAVVHSRNGLLIPYDSKVIGHITLAKARSNGDSESSLAMVFDKIQLPGGKEIPMKGILQAVGPNLGDHSGPDTGAAGPGTMPTGSGADLSTMPPPVPGAVSGPNSGVHPLENRGAVPMLNAQSVGVLGIRNLQMGKDSVLTTSDKEVKLSSGIQMLIRAEVQTPVQ